MALTNSPFLPSTVPLWERVKAQASNFLTPPLTEAERRAELMWLVKETLARTEAMTPEERRREEEHARTDPSPLGIRRRALIELIKNAPCMAEQSAGSVQEAGVPIVDTEPLPADSPAARADDVEEF